MAIAASSVANGTAGKAASTSVALSGGMLQMTTNALSVNPTSRKRDVPAFKSGRLSALRSDCYAAGGTTLQRRVVAILKRWWVAYLTRRIEETAMAQLCSMSDRELKDIGLTRAEILRAVRGGVERDRASFRSTK
jgi:uncharacterized protein YjiS (DUF1127 family)